MKRTYLYGALALSMISLSGCADEDNGLGSEGQGCMALRASFDGAVKAESRAIGETEQAHLDETLVMWVYSHAGESNAPAVIYKYEGMNNVPKSLMLNSGKYSVEAWAGDSVSASWDKRWYHGIADNIDITNGNTTNVEVKCKIANVAVAIDYDAEVLNALSVDSLVVSHARGLLAFKGNAPEHTIGYFMMPKAESTLSWTLVGRHKVGDQVEPTVYTRTSTINNVRKGYKYTFKVTLANGEADQVGGGFFDINVVEEPLETDISTVTVKLAPAIALRNSDGRFEDIAGPLNYAPGQIGEQLIRIEASGEFVDASGKHVDVVLACAQLNDIIGGTDVNLFKMTDEVGAKLNEYIQFDSKSTVDAANPDKNVWSVYVKLLKAFTDKFDRDGTYELKITATDSYGKTTEKTIAYAISDSPISVSSMEMDQTNAAPDELTVNKAVVKGAVLDASALGANPEITAYYAEGVQTGRAAWQSVPATVTGNTFSATLTGLAPGTTYSYYFEVAKADGTVAQTGIAKVTTEAALQLPNAGFEEWQNSKAPFLLYPAGGEMFWDSGNHGSATLKKNVTEPDETIKHGGSKSVKLASQFVSLFGIGKFAAGNVFIGEYLKTDGTDGVLGWGRPFTGRPAKLKGWVKYTPVAIDNKADDAPAEYVEGEMDRGILYVALMDDYTEEFVDKDKKYQYPVIVKTKASERQLFDKNSEHVVAYGEMVWNEATAGDGMVEFEVPLEYKRTGIRPTYIVLTASASKGGDYFTGGTGSTMWLDDLELIYE